MLIDFIVLFFHWWGTVCSFAIPLIKLVDFWLSAWPFLNHSSFHPSLLFYFSFLHSNNFCSNHFLCNDFSFYTFFFHNFLLRFYYLFCLFSSVVKASQACKSFLWYSWCSCITSSFFNSWFGFLFVSFFLGPISF